MITENIERVKGFGLAKVQREIAWTCGVSVGHWLSPMDVVSCTGKLGWGRGNPLDWMLAQQNGKRRKRAQSVNNDFIDVWTGSESYSDRN